MSDLWSGYEGVLRTDVSCEISYGKANISNPCATKIDTAERQESGVLHRRLDRPAKIERVAPSSARHAARHGAHNGQSLTAAAEPPEARRAKAGTSIVAECRLSVDLGQTVRRTRLSAPPLFGSQHGFEPPPVHPCAVPRKWMVHTWMSSMTAPTSAYERGRTVYDRKHTHPVSCRTRAAASPLACTPDPRTSASGSGP